MTKTGGERVQKASDAKAASTVAFKYYIHDTAAGYVLEMSGPFTEKCVSELNCCWQTAKSTLRNRNVILNVSAVSSVDAAAKLWLASMAQEGAKCSPESFLLDIEAGRPARAVSECQKNKLFMRISNLLRSHRKPVTQEL